MPGILEVVGTLNAQPKNTIIIWYQHVRKFQVFNIKTGGVAQDLSAYSFNLSSSVSTVEYRNKKLEEVSEPLSPQPAINPPRILDSPQLGQKILEIPANMYLVDVPYSETTRPAVITDIIYTKPTGEQKFFRYTILPFKAGDPS